MKLSRLLFYKAPMPASYLPRRRPNGPMFDDPRLDKILSEHKAAVRDKGYERLALPMEYHTIRSENLPESTRAVADTLKKNGFKAYLCGGSVRDMAQNAHVSDYDFVTDATKEELRRIFGDMVFQKIPTGHEFGYIDMDGAIIDVCTMVNIPACFQGLAHVPDFDPLSLYSRELLFDAYQRDITINSLYYDVETGEIIDYFGGLHDLREGIVSTTVPAKDALFYDPRILLRSLRFMARFGYSLSPDLDAAVRTYGRELLKRISASAVARNLPDFFASGFAYSGTNVLLEYGLFGDLFPAAGGMVSRDSYREYVKRCAYIADWIYDEGAVGLPLLCMAAFLWPAVSESRKRGAEEPEEEVLTAQEAVMSLHEDERDFLRKALPVDETVDRDNIMDELESIYGDPDVYDALRILQFYYRMNPVG